MKIIGQMRCPLILLILTLGAQSATWGQTAVSCSTASSWSTSTAWGLQIPCYPDEGVCFEETWFVTVQPSCFLNLAISPSITTLTLRGFIFADDQNRDITVSGTTSLEGGSIAGLESFFASGPLDVTGVSVNLYGTNLRSSSTATMSGDSSLSAGEFRNDGGLRRVGAGTTSTLSAMLDSPGTIEVESGTLRLLAGGVASSLVVVWPGAVLELGGPYEISGSMLGDGTVRLDGAGADVNATGIWNAGLEILEGSIHFSNAGTPASAAMSFGVLTGNVTIEGHLDWTGGTMAAPGVTWINATAEIIDAPFNPKLDGRALVVNAGAIVNLPGPGNDLWGVNGANVLNRGTVNVVEGIPLFAHNPGDADFNNVGLFTKSGLNTATVQFGFANSGTVHVTGGQLEFTQDYVQFVGPSVLTVPVTQLSGALIGDTGALVDIQEGFLQGYGAVESAVQSTGVISPGVESINSLTFEKSLTLGPGSALEFELAGAMGEGMYDSILVFDSLVLDGDLLVTFVNGFENAIQPGDSFDLATVLSTNAIQGQLAGQPNGSQLLTADGHGFFTVEYGPGASFPDLLRLTNYQPATPNPAGSVPDGDDVPGLPLLVGKATGTEITLTWGASCAPGDTDYEIYQGEIGDYDSHVKMDPCSTAGATSATFDPPLSVDTYYLLVPTNGMNEGSYGLRSDGTERPQPPHPADRCRPQQIAAVCP